MFLAVHAVVGILAAFGFPAVVSVPAVAGVPNVVKIPSVYVVSTGSCALLLASPDVLFYCPQPFCLSSSFSVHFSGVPAVAPLRLYML